MEQITCEGGPMDGRTVEVPPETGQLEVRMEDNTRHRYVREDATTFGWRGRF